MRLRWNPHEEKAQQEPTSQLLAIVISGVRAKSSPFWTEREEAEYQAACAELNRRIPVPR